MKNLLKVSIVMTCSVLFVVLTACQNVNTENTMSVSDVAEPGDSNSGGDIGGGVDENNVPAPDTDLVYAESFAGTDGESWPSPWEAAENSPPFVADLQGDRARIQGDPGMVLRMVNAGISIVNCDVTFSVEFENFSNQGVGFYCRQNGGYLNQSTVPGQGYAVFLEGNGGNLGLWYELEGDEVRHQSSSLFTIFGSTLADNTEYRIRFQVVQFAADLTLQQAKVWPADESEPVDWQVVSDEQPDFGEAPINPMAIPNLQNTSGGIVIDLYNYAGSGSIFISDLTVSEL